MDAFIRGGQDSRFGECMLVREEPHKSSRGNRTNIADVDVLRAYLLLDRLHKSNVLPKDIVPKVVHDLGGSLFADVHYFSSSDPDAGVEKADAAELEATGAELMPTIVGAAEVK